MDGRFCSDGLGGGLLDPEVKEECSLLSWAWISAAKRTSFVGDFFRSGDVVASSLI